MPDQSGAPAGWTLALPDFDDYDWWETETRGVLLNLELVHGDRRVPVTFYDPVRLAQSIGSEEPGRPFYEANLIVVPAVTKAAVEQAVRQLGETGSLDWML